MINVDKLASILMRRCGCEREDAISAISEAWLTADHSKSEPEVAAYLLEAGGFRYLDTVSSQTKYVRENQQAKAFIASAQQNSDKYKNWDGSIRGLLEITLPAPPDEETDTDYIVTLVRDVPEEFKWPVMIVCHDLLTSRIKKRQPLTVEMTRQLLKRRQIPNTSEVARQVYTFLTTRIRHG